jgi:hypothetical protein
MKWFNLKMSLFELLLIESFDLLGFLMHVCRSLLYFLHSYDNSELSSDGVKEGLVLAITNKARRRVCLKAFTTYNSMIVT